MSTHRSSDPEEVITVSASILRELFNSSQMRALIDQGSLTPVYLRDTHLTAPENVAEERCTRGQMIRYLDHRGVWLVEVFQYVRADGSLDASGLQDPKRMRTETAIWQVERA